MTYTAVTPVPTDLRGAVSMGVGLDENTPDTLAFPVVQECVEGSTEWTQLAENGEDPHSLDAPAPVVSVTDLATGSPELPATDAIILLTQADDRVIVRPSGTEPKLKCYLEVVVPVEGDDIPRDAARERLSRLGADITAVLGL